MVAGCILLCCMSCRKEFSSSPSAGDYKACAKRFLQHNRVAGDPADLDWEAVSVTDLPGTFFRVGFRNKAFARDFVLLKFRDEDSVEGAGSFTS
jgi:hypothetical protein